jgi:hypothetical protein
MNFIQLIKERECFYKVQDRVGRLSVFFSYFLTDDVGLQVQNWKDLINDPKRDGTSSNISFLEKEGENVIVGYLFAPENDPYKNSTKLSKQNLLEVLDQWEKLCKEKPQEIWIFEENGKVWLEGKN